DDRILGREPVHRPVRGEVFDQPAQRAQHAAMRDDDGAARQLAAELRYADREVVVALALGRPEVPEARVALAGNGHRAGRELDMELSLVDAEGELDQPRIDGDGRKLDGE